MIVKLAMNRDKANNPLYWRFEVAEIAGQPVTASHHRAESAVDPLASRFSEAQALSRTAPWPPAWRLEDPLQRVRFGTLATIGSTVRWDQSGHENAREMGSAAAHEIALDK